MEYIASLILLDSDMTSPISSVSLSSDKQLLAVAAPSLPLRVFCYPAYLPEQEPLELECHASQVAFMAEEFLISAADDGGLLIWSYKGILKKQTMRGLALDLSMQGKKDADVNEQLERVSVCVKKEQPLKKTVSEDENLLE